MLEGQGGLTQQHFNVGEMKTLMVKVPGLDEQKRIENLLLKHDETIDEAKQSHEKFRSLKTALMQDLLTGKVHVIPFFDKQGETA